MMPVAEIQAWLASLPAGSAVGVDEGGLVIRTVDGAWLEIGGIPEQEQPEPECACVRVDVDREDARDCPAHGPHSEAARAWRVLEAADEAAAAARIPFWLGLTPEEMEKL
jgi:hypothetical protein